MKLGVKYHYSDVYREIMEYVDKNMMIREGILGRIILWGNDLLAPGENRHSGPGEKRQIWPNENRHLQNE